MNIEEKEIKVEQFKKVLLGMDYPIKILSTDNSIDLTNNIESLKSIKKIETDNNKNNLLEEDINFAENIFSQNFIFNREFYIIIGNEINDEKLLKQKINDIVFRIK